MSGFARFGALRAGVVVAGLAGLWMATVPPALAVTRPICFPVVEAVPYAESFGAPRSGGRTHEGNDLMGQKMHRLVAATDGVLVDVRGPGSGKRDHSVRMRADDGWYYAYLHMNNDTPGTDDGRATTDQVFGPGIVNGARVKAGQLLGYMGDSGNAEDTSPHLHFEMRQPAPSVWQSVAVSPYDSLRAARRCSTVASASRGFTALGGQLSSDPDVASSGSASSDVFARGTDGQLWHRALTSGGDGGWAPLGGLLSSGPGAVAHAGKLIVFVRGQDGSLWSRQRSTAGTWDAWTALGGAITSDPEAASDASNVIVVARGADNAMWSRTQSNGTWSSWRSLGGRFRSGPGVAWPTSGPQVFGRDADDALWRADAGTGTGPAPAWSRLGGKLRSDPEATVHQGAVHVVVKGADERLWHSIDGGPWATITTGPVQGGAGLVTTAAGRLDLVVVGLDRAAYNGWYTSGSW